MDGDMRWELRKENFGYEKKIKKTLHTLNGIFPLSLKSRIQEKLTLKFHIILFCYSSLLPTQNNNSLKNKNPLIAAF